MRRVTWQATSDDENSCPRYSVARQPRGRLRRARSSRRCRLSARWLLATSARKNSGGSFGRDYAIWGISRDRTFDLSFGRRKDRSTDFPNWQLSWFVSRSMSLSLGLRPPLWRQSKRRMTFRSSWPRQETPSVRGLSRAFLGRAEMSPGWLP